MIKVQVVIVGTLSIDPAEYADNFREEGGWDEEADIDKDELAAFAVNALKDELEAGDAEVEDVSFVSTTVVLEI